MRVPFIPNATLCNLICLVLAVAVVLFLPGLASPQQPKEPPTLKEMLGPSSEEEQAQAKPKIVQTPIPEDEFGRGTPRTTVEGYFQAAEEHDFKRAAQYLDLRNLPRRLSKTGGPKLARQLKTVLDRSLWIDLDLVSSHPRGHRNDGLPRYRDLLGQTATPEKTVDILLQRVPRGDGVYIWKFSSATVAEIPLLYKHYGHGHLEAVLPKALFDFEILGFEAGFWVATFLILLISLAIAFIPTAGIAFLLRRKGTLYSTRLARLMTGPIRLLIFAVVGRELLVDANPPVEIRAVVEAATLFVIAAAWTGVRLLDFLMEHMVERFKRRGQLAPSVFLPPLVTAGKILLITIALLIWVDNLGFKVTTLLAGLGIGGLAVALAAQKSLENLIGAVTLYAARPVSPGDFCRFGDKLGTVEEIGLRSTRLRTLDDSLVSVPNAEFAALHLDNYSKRGKLWYHPRVRLRYETTPEQVRYILVEVRKMLYAHPKVLPDPARIRFTGLGTYSLDLDIFAYIDMSDYGEFLGVAEDLNLRIMDIVAESGSKFAFPSQTMYHETGVGLDQERARAAEAQVREWRTQKSLYLPDFPNDKIAEIQGSLEYPPAGSPWSPARA